MELKKNIDSKGDKYPKPKDVEHEYDGNNDVDPITKVYFRFKLPTYSECAFITN